MKMNFEIVISKADGKFKALCPAFPDCMGIGDTEPEAVEDLGNVITMHLSDTVRHTIDDISRLGLLKRVSNSTSNAKQEASSEMISFLDKTQDLLGKNLFTGKLPIPQDWLKIVDKRAFGSKNRKIMGVGMIPPMYPPMFDEVQMPYHTEVTDESLLFGVPLSLN